MTYSIEAQEKREKKLEKQSKLAEQQLQQDIEKTFGTPHGRRVLYEILSTCGVYHDCFTGNSRSFYLEGKRAVGLHIIDLVGMKLYIKLLQEVENGRI